MLMATTLADPSHSEGQISREDIDRSLHAYPPPNRFIREAHYKDNDLTVWAASFPHPFHEPWMEHLTREHAVLYTTQVSYLLIQAAIDAGDFPYLSAEHYRYVCRSEEGLMSKIAVRFHRTAPVPARVHIVARIKKSRQIHGSVYVNCHYRIADICSAEAWLTSPVG